ncbi:MAG: triose-phosphate isomerase [Thermoleophilia bacterium]|jgi:triosephosphate isomerase
MTARIPVVAGNWKMFKTPAEGDAFIRAFSRRLGDVEDVEVLVAPPFTGLAAAVAAAMGTTVGVAAQNVFWEKEGAFTGEVAPGMLVSLGVRWVIIGHSERRQLFGETDQGIARKLRASLDHGLRPILCVGETEGERDAGLTEERLMSQVGKALAGVTAAEAGPVSIAYEPVWAIGTGRTATPQQAQEACALIRRRAAELLGAEAGAQMRILYGGSVKPDNFGELMGQEDIDGGLVGGASLDVDSFARIVEAAF